MCCCCFHLPPRRQRPVAGGSGAEQPRNRIQMTKATSIPHPALPLLETRVALFAPAIYKT